MVASAPGLDDASMPRTLSFPPPSVHVCPDCDGPVAAGRCGACGLGLEHPEAGTLWWLDLELHRLAGQRAAVLDRLRGADSRPTRAPGPVASPAAPPAAPPTAPPTTGGGVRLQHLLLGLGAFCLVVAAVVFAAVTWHRLGAVAQGAILLGFTGLAGGAAAFCRSRDLRSTAEAIALVAVALALADVHAERVGLLGDADASVVWSAGLALVAAATWAFSRVVPLGVARLAALATGSLPGVILAVRWADSAEVVAAVLLVQAAGLVTWLRLTRARTGEGWYRALVAALALGQWGLAVLVATVEALLAEWSRDTVTGPVLLLAAAAGLAVAVAAAWPARDVVRALGTGVGTALALAATALAMEALTTLDEGRWLLATAGVAVLVVAGARLAVPARWGAAPSVVASGLALAATLPAVDAVLAAVFGPLALLADPWLGALDDPVRPLLPGDPWPGSALTLAFVAVPWALVALWSLPSWGGRPRAGWRMTPGTGAAAAALLTGITAAVLPLALDGSVLMAVGTLLVGAVGATTWAALGGRAAPAALALAGGCAAFALTWASVSAPGTIVALCVVVVVGLAAAAASVRRGDRSGAVCGVVLAYGAGSLLALTGPLAAGHPAATAWWWLAAFAAVSSAGGWAAERRGSGPAAGSLGAEGWRTLATTVDGLAAAAFAAAVIELRGRDAFGELSVALLLGVATLAAHALRPSRRGAIWAATTLAVALAWLRLAVAGVQVVEAYTLPAAVALLAAGALHGRRAGSWISVGPGLMVAAVPSVLAAWTDPGMVRPLSLAVGGVAVVLAGAHWRQQAPVVIGAITVAAVGVDQLSPLVAAAPRYLTFAVLGAVLLSVGATFEQRRRDAAELWDRFEALR